MVTQATDSKSTHTCTLNLEPAHPQLSPSLLAFSGPAGNSPAVSSHRIKVPASFAASASCVQVASRNTTVTTAICPIHLRESMPVDLDMIPGFDRQ
ncbi:hypothetical protein E2P81_ATG11913 [Venturia nashicola]|nr:hypothetical protein E2P81_ATG11913 [Venturia nashicola]